MNSYWNYDLYVSLLQKLDFEIPLQGGVTNILLSNKPPLKIFMQSSKAHLRCDPYLNFKLNFTVKSEER